MTHNQPNDSEQPKPTLYYFADEGYGLTVHYGEKADVLGFKECVERTAKALAQARIQGAEELAERVNDMTQESFKYAPQSDSYVPSGEYVLDTEDVAEALAAYKSELTEGGK